MNFNQLLIFQKVAELGHFTRAANALFISQPAVSKQVRELELSLGQPLFEQVGRKVYLTAAGKLLYDYACRIFALSQEAEIALQELQGLQRGHLKIGASMTIGTYFLPQLLGQYRKLYPAIELELDIANVEEVQQKLLNNQVEVGFIEDAASQPELAVKTWRPDELVLIDSVQQPVIAEESLCLAGLVEAGLPFILREKGSGTRAVLEKALAERGLAPFKPVMELNSLEAIKRSVAAGLGVSFISEHTIELETTLGLLKRKTISDFRLKRQLFLVYSPSKRVSKAAQAFLEMLDQPPVSQEK